MFMYVCVFVCVSHHPRQFYFCNEELRVPSRGLHKQGELWSEHADERKEEVEKNVTS